MVTVKIKMVVKYLATLNLYMNNIIYLKQEVLYQINYLLSVKGYDERAMYPL